MSINPKLEFFRFSLNHKNEEFKTFKDFAIEELGVSKSITNEKVFESCFNHFIKSLKTDYSKNEKLKKRIVIESKKSINKHHDKKPTHNSADYTISGVINGGLYGRERIIANNDDADDSSTLGMNKTVLMYFYIFLYLPPDHNEGFFMVHSNGKEETITNIFRNYIGNIFRGKKFNKSQINEYCPKSFQDEFKKGATLKSLSFKSSFIDDVPSTSAIENNFQNYDIYIEAIPKNKDISSSVAENFLNYLKSKVFGSKHGGKKLEDFDKTKLVLENDINKSTKTFEWNAKDNEFVPVVYLNERITKKNADETPDFEELKEYCKTIFKDEILPEIRPDLNVSKAK